MNPRDVALLLAATLLVGCQESDGAQDTSPSNDTSDDSAQADAAEPDTSDLAETDTSLVGDTTDVALPDFCETHPDGYPYMGRTIYPAVDGVTCDCPGAAGEWEVGDPLLGADYVPGPPYLSCHWYNCGCSSADGVWHCHWAAGGVPEDEDECLNPPSHEE